MKLTICINLFFYTFMFIGCASPPTEKPSYEDNSLLFNAIQSENYKQLDTIIENGGEINIHEMPSGKTPLMYAIT